MLPVAFSLCLLLTAQDSLERLLRQLEDDDISAREEATWKLMNRPLADLPILEKARDKAKNAELHQRLQRAVIGVRRRRHDELIRNLSDAKEDDYAKAVQALDRLDPPGVLRHLRSHGGDKVDQIMAALLDIFREDEEVFRTFLRDHYYSIPREFAPRLVPYLSSADPILCENALLGLLHLRKYKGPLRGVNWRDVASRVTAVAGTDGHSVRLAAIEALAVVGDDRSLEVLNRSARDPMEKIQRVSLETLLTLFNRYPARKEEARRLELLLGSNSPDVRRLTYELLAVFPEPEGDTPRVRRALKEEPPKARWGALELAAALKDPSFADQIAGLISEKDGAKAVEALFRLSPSHVAERLLDCYGRHEDITSAWIIHLELHGDPNTAEPFRRGLADVVANAPKTARETALRTADQLEIRFDAETVAAVSSSEDEWTRRTAFESVSSALTQRGIEVLRAGLKDPEVYVREEAIQAVGRAKATALREDLLHLLEKDPRNRGDAIEALGSLGDRSVLPTLFPYLLRGEGGEALGAIEKLARPEDASRLMESARRISDRNRRHRAVGLAADLLGSRAIETLRPLIGDRRLRSAVLNALAAREAVECAPDAARHLDDSDPSVVGAAAALIGQARHEAAIPDLLNLLKDGDVRSSAKSALARMPREKVVPKIVGYIESPDYGLRRAAVEILYEIDADELADRTGAVLHDESFSIALYGVRTVKRRKLKEHLDRVEILSRCPRDWLRREALETLAELDWERRRVSLLDRLRRRDVGALTEIAPLFTARNDEAALSLLLGLSGEDGETGYEAMVALNGYRKPEATKLARAPTHSGIGTIIGRSLRQKAARLSERTGCAIRVELPPAPAPRASFERAFAGRSRSGGGGGRYGFRRSSGRYSLLQKMKVGLGTKVVPIVDDDVVRLLPREKAVDFWKTWAEQRRR